MDDFDEQGGGIVGEALGFLGGLRSREDSREKGDGDSRQPLPVVPLHENWRYSIALAARAFRLGRR